MLEGKRISELETVTNLQTGCCFPVLSTGATKRITFGSLLSEIENNLPETGIDQVKEDVEQLKIKTEKIDTLSVDVENVKETVADVDEMVQGQNAAIRNCVSTVEGLEQVIETTHFDDVLELENDVRANTTNVTSINEKIPAQASAENKLADSASVERKLDKTTTAENAGKAVVVDEEGNLTFGEAGVQVSQEEGNAIEEKDDGIYVPSGLSGVPIGTIVSWSSDNIPAGFLKFDGTTYNKSDYPVLYTRIPNEWKIDENTFKLPDLKDKFIQGANNNLGESIEAGLPNITGTLALGDPSDNVNDYTNSLQTQIGAFYSDTQSAKCYNENGATGKANIPKFSATKGETKTDGTLKTADEPHVYGNSDTVQPPAIALHFIIKATDYSQATEDVIDDTKATTGNVWSASKTKEEIETVDNKNNYSTEEIIVGKWIDGRPIYKKSFYFSSISNGTVIDDNSIDKVLIETIGNGLINNQYYPFPMGNAAGESMIKKTNNKFVYNGAWTTNELYFSIKYIKTTD